MKKHNIFIIKCFINPATMEFEFKEVMISEKLLKFYTNNIEEYLLKSLT